MANHATDNTPSEEHVRAAVENIEQSLMELATERGVYMSKCKRIREAMATDYDEAADHGIAKKLLKTIIKERELERRIEALTLDFEPDERSELEMLVEKLGEFANTPLGQAAMHAAGA